MYKILHLNFFIFLSVLIFAQSKPQEPIPPFPYESEDIIIENKKDSVKIGATLTKPKGLKNYGVAILISGSGAQNRDSELLGHKPFLVIADYLTRNNIAVLRMDDRGVGTSTGNYAIATLLDLKEDVQYVVEYLRQRDDIDKKKIGMIGHSLGGIVAPMVAADDKELGFVIMMAGSGERGDQVMLKQKELIETKMGIGPEMVATGQKNMKALYQVILNYGHDGAALKDSLTAHFKNTYGNQLPEFQLNAMVKQLNVPWLLDFIRHDPTPALQQIKCPLLAIGGSNDLQVPAAVNLEAIKKAVTEGGNSNVEVLEYPKLNHLFQECESGLPNEYTTIQQTISPQVLEKMVAWLKEKRMM